MEKDKPSSESLRLTSSCTKNVSKNIQSNKVSRKNSRGPYESNFCYIRDDAQLCL